MDDFFYKDKRIGLSSITGKVLADRKYLETIVSSSCDGDEGIPDIYSHSVMHHEFWIKSAEGMEHDLKLLGVDIPLRERQTVTVISAISVEAGNEIPAVIVNYSADKHWYLNEAPALLKKLNVKFISAGTYGMIGVPVVAGFLLNSGGVLGCSLAIGLFFLAFKAHRINEASEALAAHLEGVAMDLLGRERKPTGPTRNDWVGQ